MRKEFTKTIDSLMERDKDIILLPIDVGYGVLDNLEKKYPDRVQNHGINEQHTISLATGLAIGGKLPIVYSINSFLTFRGTEQIRMLKEMNQKVILVGVGLEDEYKNFGISHYSFGDKEVLDTLGIKVLTPKTKEDVRDKVIEAYNKNEPSYIRLSKY